MRQAIAMWECFLRYLKNRKSKWYWILTGQAVVLLCLSIAIISALAQDPEPYHYVYNIEDAFTAWNLAHHQHAQRALNQYIMQHCRVEMWDPSHPMLNCMEFGYDMPEEKKP